MSSRSVSLTSTFLLLAAGGAAGCGNDQPQNEGFYCADANGVIVDEDYCDDDDSYHGGSGFFIWHSSGYRSGYPVGSRLPAGGSKFAYNDAASRSKYGLPTTGRVGNGTIKSGVVGKGGSGSHGSSGG